MLLSCEKKIEYSTTTTHWSNLDFDSCDYEPCPNLSLNYVVLNSPEKLAYVANTELNNAIIKRLTFKGQNATSIREGIEIYLANSQNAYPEAATFSDAHELQMDIEIGYSSNDILSLQCNSYEFAGGAHKTESIHFWNYNPKTAQRLKNNALFKDIEAFSAFAKAQFIKIYGPLKSFWFKNGFTLPENIGFNKEGLILFYNVYEIAHYTDGAFQLILSWEEVKDYLAF